MTIAAPQVRDLLIHVPHASTFIPEDVWSEFLVPRDQVEAEALASADLYTDEMARQAWPQAKIIQAQVSRIVVDVERYEDDIKEEMAAVGRGVLYTHDHNQIEIRKRLSGPRRKELLAQYEEPALDPGTREALEACVARRKAEGGAPTN